MEPASAQMCCARKFLPAEGLMTESPWLPRADYGTK